MIDSNFFIKREYNARKQPDYFYDPIIEDVINQPEVYSLAGYFAQKLGCKNIIDIGCGNCNKLITLNDFNLIGIDIGKNISKAKNHYGNDITFIEFDLENNQEISIPTNLLSDSVIICSDVIEHLMNPTFLLTNIKSMLDFSPLCLLSTPERDISRGKTDCGPPKNPHHCREWNTDEFKLLLNYFDFNLDFLGLTVQNDFDWKKRTMLALLKKNQEIENFSSKPFKVVSIMSTFNDEDIIEISLNNLIKYGISVYLIDHNSTDNTAEIAKQFLDKGLIGIQTFQNNENFLQQIFKTINEIISPNWYIFQNAHEIIESPWINVDLLSALHRVDNENFDAIDFVEIIFHSYNEKSNFESRFNSSFFEFNQRSPYYSCIKACKNHLQNKTMILKENRLMLSSKNVYPIKFLIRKYLPSIIDIDFIKPKELLQSFDNSFYSLFLVERISGIGISGITHSRSNLLKSLDKAIKDVEILQDVNIHNQNLIKELSEKDHFT